MAGMKVGVPAGHEGDTGYYRILLSSDEPEAGAYPELTDPATRGCLLELVRQAWNQASISTRYSEYQDRVEWDVPTPVEQERVRDMVFFTGKTEVEALVAALEAAP
jgi:hypothetical protein